MRRSDEPRRAAAVEQQLKYIGETLRTGRKTQRMTVKRLEAAAKVSDRRIEHIEGGDANPSLRTVLLLAYELGMRLELVPGPPAPIKIIRATPAKNLRFHTAVRVCQLRGLDPANLDPADFVPRRGRR